MLPARRCSLDPAPVVRALQGERRIFRDFQFNDDQPTVEAERQQVNGARAARARRMGGAELSVQRREPETRIEPRDVAPQQRFEPRFGSVAVERVCVVAGFGAAMLDKFFQQLCQLRPVRVVEQTTTPRRDRRRTRRAPFPTRGARARTAGHETVASRRDVRAPRQSRRVQARDATRCSYDSTRRHGESVAARHSATRPIPARARGSSHELLHQPRRAKPRFANLHAATPVARGSLRPISARRAEAVSRRFADGDALPPDRTTTALTREKRPPLRRRVRRPSAATRAPALRRMMRA